MQSLAPATDPGVICDAGFYQTGWSITLNNMRERHREIKRRRHRYAKRVKLRLKLKRAGDDAQRQELQEKIRRTYPRYAEAQ